MKSNQITLHDLAEKLNLSPSTISRALSNHPGIGDTTKKRVLALAKKWNFEINSVAKSLREGKVNSIGVIVPKINRHFFSSIIGTIEMIAKQSGFHVIICQNNDFQEIEKENIKALIASKVAGICASIAMETTDYSHFQNVIDRSIPLVFFDRVCNTIDTHKIIVDDYSGAFKITEHLIKSGYKKIAHFGGSTKINVYQNRLNGYLDALKLHGLPIHEDFIIHFDLTTESGSKYMEKLFSLKERPDSLFSASDYAAIGGLNFLKENNLPLPPEFGLAGFSNEPFASFITPSLTTVEQYPEEIGKMVAETIISEILMKEKTMVFKTTMITPKLIVRDSTKKQV